MSDRENWDRWELNVGHELTGDELFVNRNREDGRIQIGIVNGLDGGLIDLSPEQAKELADHLTQWSLSGELGQGTWGRPDPA